MRHTNWNSLYTFWLVARSGSFAEAARQFPAATVQALHKRVRQLEDESNLDLKLLRSRGVKGIELTEAGSRFLELLDPVFSSAELLAADLRKEAAGPLTLAATGFAAHNYLPRVMAAFHPEFPLVTVSVRVRSESDVTALVEAGQADIGIGAVLGESGLLTVRARRPLSLCLVAPQRFKWRAEAPNWGDVVEHPLILHERVSVLRLSLEELLTRRKLISRLRIAAEVTTPELAIEMVRAGFGIALIPLGPRLTSSLGDLSVIAAPSGLPSIPIAVFHRRKRYLPHYMESFMKIARRAIDAESCASPLD